MTIEDKNKLIAEFMNYPKDSDGRFHTPYLIHFSDNPWDLTEDDFTSVLEAYELRFNTDWNWLMTVVEKIENLKIKDHTKFDIIICKNSVEILGFRKGWECVRFRTGLYNGLTKIESLYEMIVEFIIWYNKK